MVAVMNLKPLWRRLWNRHYLQTREEYVTRLRHSAPTVTPEEAAKLARKWAKPQPPVNYGELGVLE